MKTILHQAASRCRISILFILLLLSVHLNAQESMRANLYIVDANGQTLVDGNLTNYNNIYSNNVDINDGWKMANPGINFGILRSTITLVVERRSVYTTSDTTFFRMWNMPQANYRIKFMLKNLNHLGMRGIIRDMYKNTETTIGLNDTTYFNFAVTADPASANEQRFQLVYGPNLAGPVDVNFTGIHLLRKGNGVLVKWDVAGETSIESYTVEHAADGRNFSSLKQVKPGMSSGTARSYDYLDADASKTEGFYRIKALSLGGRVQYSNIAKINACGLDKEINVYPNPVINKTVQLQFNNQPGGKYDLVLLYSNGVQQQLTSFQIAEGQSSFTLNLPQNIKPGIYRLQFRGPGTMLVKTINVL